MTTATVLKMDNINEFKHLSNFNSLKDFNNNLEQILLDHKKDFTKSQLIGLKQLARFSAKVVGVATARICKIVEATFTNNKIGISSRTFQRTIKIAEGLGIITVLNGERFNGSQSSNIYVFNRYETVKKCAELNGETASEVIEIVSDNETIDVPDLRKLSPLKALNLLKHLVFKQENSTIQPTKEDGFNAVMDDAEKTRALLQEHNVNDFQLQLFDMIMSENFPKPVHQSAGILALITGNDCTASKVIKAYQVVWSIAININDGVQINNVKAVFRERMGMPIDRYEEVKERNAMKAMKPRTVKRVPLYDWLRNRG